MVHFRQRSTTRNYFSRREQRRLLVIVMLLGFVVLAMSEAGKPENWAWMWAGQATGEQPTGERPTGEQRPAAKPPSPPLPQLGPDDPTDAVLIAAAPVVSPAKEPASEEYYPGVNREYLKAVQDGTLWLYDDTTNEKRAWFNLMEVLQRSDDESLDKASSGLATYAHLSDQARSNRGKLLTITGTVRRCTHEKVHPAEKNDLGIEGYYKMWVAIDRETVVLYSLHLPEGFPRQADMVEKIGATGFYFKRLGFVDDRNKLADAPLLLVRGVRWIPAEEVAAAEETFSLVHLGWMVAAAAIVAVVIAGWVYFRTG